MAYFGVDLSEHNGSVDWGRLAENVDFAILRIGWVGNKNNHTVDDRFEEYYRAARAAGVKIGVYVYIYSNSETTAREGAEWAVKHLAGKTVDLPVYCDMEDSSLTDLGRAKITSIAKAFNSVIEKAGYWAGIYANKNWYDNYLEKGIEKRYTSWIAHYTGGTDKYKGEYDVWQNSSDGSVGGLSGRVDTNYMYRNLFRAVNGKNEPDKPAQGSFPTPVKWQNGYSNEPVYKQNDLTEKIGTIFPYASELCYSRAGNALLVVYSIDGTNKHKAGFVGYKGGVEKAPPESKTWINGYTPEVVYADTGKQLSVGSINPYGRAYCLGRIDGMYLVLYYISGTNIQKAGFVDYHGGVK